jgi:hypothetical protein
MPKYCRFQEAAADCSGELVRPFARGRPASLLSGIVGLVRRVALLCGRDKRPGPPP